MMTRVLRANAFGLLPLLCALYLILYLDRVNIATAAPLIQSELHLRNAALGVVLSAFAYSYAFCQLIGGFVGERFGPPTDSLPASVLVVCVATAATGLASGLAALVAARMVLGFGEGAALPTATQAMAKHLPQTQWGFAQGITHSFAQPAISRRRRLCRADCAVVLACFFFRVCCGRPDLGCRMVGVVWRKRNGTEASCVAAGF